MFKSAENKFYLYFALVNFLVAIVLSISIINSSTAYATHNPAAFSKNVRTGTVSLAVTDLTKTVTFSSAMPSSSYTCVFERTGVVATVVSTSSKTTAGFTANISIGITETPKYLCVED